MGYGKVYIKEKFVHKVIRHLKNDFNALFEFSQNKNEFGSETAKVILKRKFNCIDTEKYINYMSKYMDDELKSITKKYIDGDYVSYKNNDRFNKYPIWICWLQGEENIPEPCKTCVDNIRKKLPEDAELIFITYENYLSYVDIPQDIVEKHNKGFISPTNYTDIIRHGLLSKYGGAWIDSGIFLTGDIFDKAITYDIFTPKFKTDKLEDASRGKWVNGIWFSNEGNIIFNYVYDSLIYFWRNHNRAVEYLAADYILWTAYTNLNDAKKLIDSIPYNNQNIRLLNNHLYDVYDSNLYEEIVTINQIHVINRHQEYPTVDENNAETFYGCLISGKLE